MAQQKVSDTLFEALDIIINKRIEAVQKDKTILCVVEDNSKAEEGEYIVSNASAKFTAYSENTKYRNGQNVWVLIPEGDYNNEKKIIGKHVGDSSTPYIYVDPMDSYANMTGNVLNGVMDFSENGLLANCSAPKNIFTGATIGADRIPTDMTSAYTVDTTELDITGGFKFTVSLANYDRMGISAKFRTNFGSLDPLNGSYGLIFIIKTLVDVDTMTDAEATAYNNELNAELDLLQLEWVNTANITQEQADQMIADYIRHFNLRKENLAKAHKEERFITVIFDSKDMWGNPYGYNVPFTQTMCVDINPAVNGTPVAITGFFYQNYDFVNTNGVIPYYTPNQYGVDGEPVDSAGYTLLPANIFVQDINVSFGYAVDKVEDDTIFLFTQNNNTYRVNNSNYTKLLETRYIYVGEDNTRIAINSFADLNEYLAKSENLKNLAPMIRWYRYKLQEGMQDARAGDFWEEFYPDYEATTGSSPRLTGGWFSKEVNDLISPQDERFKCILCYNPKFAYYIRSYILALSKEGKTNTLEYKYHMAIWTWWFRTVCGWTGTASSTNAEFNKAFPYNTDVQLALDNENRVTSNDIWEQWAASDERIVSQELVFTNQDNAYDSTRDLVQALRLTADDPSHGVFNIYESTFGANNNLINSNDEKIARRVKATFWSAVSENEELNEVERLAWYIPRHNTMIKAPQSGVDYQTYKRIELSADTYETNKYYTKSGTTYSLSTGDFNADVTYYNRSNEKYINSVAAINALIDISDEERALFKERIKDYYIIIDDEVSSKADKTKEAILIYHIKPELKKHWTNNTIRASAYRYKRNYEGENAQFTPTFGVKGTNGTDYTLSLSMLQETDANEKVYYNPPAWTWGSSTATGSANTIRGTRTASMQLRVQLFDPDDKEVELKASQCKWSFLFPTNGKITKGTTTKSLWELKTSYAATSTATSVKSLTPVLIPGQWFTEYETNTVSQYEGAILKCEVTLQKDAFVGYLTIPMRKSRNYIGMEGPSIVRYEASGTGAKYYDAPYGILDIDENIIYNNSNGEENNVTLELMHINDAKYLPVVSNLLNPLEENVAKQKPSKDGHYHLFPKAMHFNNVEYCAYVKIHDGNTTAFLWSQPLLILIDPYGNEFLNNWGGELNIDYDGNTIMSAVMGAGKKESDNTFTGLLLGDLPKNNVQAANKTGLLGYEHGEQAYGIFDDGTMFLGKLSRAQLKLDGTDGYIKNAGYDNGEGIMIDFDGAYDRNTGASNAIKPYIDLKASTGAQIYLGTGGNPTKNLYFSIKSPGGNDGNNSELIHIGKEQYYLQTDNYSDTNRTGLKINLANGTLNSYDKLTINGASGSTIHFGNNINYTELGYDGTKGYLTSIGNLTLQGGNIGAENSIYLSTDNATATVAGQENKNNWRLTIGKNFGVDANGNMFATNGNLTGKITANEGTIGGFNITTVADLATHVFPNSLYIHTSANNYDYEAGLSKASKATDLMFYVKRKESSTGTWENADDMFFVRANGSMKATAGTIGGWNITESSLYKGNTHLYSSGTIKGAFISGATISGSKITIGGSTQLDDDTTVSGTLNFSYGNATYSLAGGTVSLSMGKFGTKTINGVYTPNSLAVKNDLVASGGIWGAKLTIKGDTYFYGSVTTWAGLDVDAGEFRIFDSSEEQYATLTSDDILHLHTLWNAYVNNGYSL